MILSQLKRYVCHYFMSFDCSFFTCYESEEETTALYMRRRMIISQQWTRITHPSLSPSLSHSFQSIYPLRTLTCTKHHRLLKRL